MGNNANRLFIQNKPKGGTMRTRIKTEGEAFIYVYNLKSRVAKDNALRWFIKNKEWYL